TGRAKYPTSASEGEGRARSATSWYQDQTAMPKVHPSVPRNISGRHSQVLRGRPARTARRQVIAQQAAAKAPAASWAPSSTIWDARSSSTPVVASRAPVVTRTAATAEITWKERRDTATGRGEGAGVGAWLSGLTAGSVPPRM